MKEIMAKKPPMGWNSFDSFGWSVNEEEMLRNIDFIANNLKEYGYEYVTVDFCWAMPGRSNDPNPHQREGFTPKLNLDKYGRLLPDMERFPTSKNGVGFKWLSDYVHSKGLKFAIHIMRGIPRQAVHEKTMVIGTEITADMIADTSSECVWLNHMYGLDMKMEGAQEYLNSIVRLYASWDVDYLKIDDLSYPYHKEEIEGYRKAIDSCDRPMIFSTSPGETPLEEGEHIMKHASLWRISSDFWDRWEDVRGQFKRLHDWSPFRQEGHWPDADMLPLGKLSLFGPMEEPRNCRLSADEQQTMITLWCFAKSPLILGGDASQFDEKTVKMITNKELIKINQESCNNSQWFEENGIVSWKAFDTTYKEDWIAIFNISDEDRESIKIKLPEEKFGEVSLVRDITTGVVVKLKQNKYVGCLKAHQSLVLHLIK